MVSVVAGGDWVFCGAIVEVLEHASVCELVKLRGQNVRKEPTGASDLRCDGPRLDAYSPSMRAISAAMWRVAVRTLDP